MCYKGLQGVIKGYNWLQEITRVTKGYNGLRGLQGARKGN